MLPACAALVLAAKACQHTLTAAADEEQEAAWAAYIADKELLVEMLGVRDDACTHRVAARRQQTRGLVARGRLSERLDAESSSGSRQWS